LAGEPAPARVRTPCPSRPATSARNSPTAAGSWFSWATLLTASSTASQFGRPNGGSSPAPAGRSPPSRVARRVLSGPSARGISCNAASRSTQGKQRATQPSPRRHVDVGLAPSRPAEGLELGARFVQVGPGKPPGRGRSAWRSEGRSRTPAAPLSSAARRGRASAPGSSQHRASRYVTVSLTPSPLARRPAPAAPRRGWLSSISRLTSVHDNSK